MNRKQKRALIAGAVMIAILGILNLFTGGEEPEVELPTKPAVEEATEGTVKVIVAKVTIDKQTRIKESMLETIEVPISQAQSGGATSVKSVLDNFSMVRIFEREQLLMARLGESSSADVGLAYVLQRNKRAFSIRMSTDRAVGGYIAPGMIVDIIGAFTTQSGPVTRPVLQRVKILAINDNHIVSRDGKQPKVQADPNDPNKKAEGFDQINPVQTVTFELTPVEAEKLMLAATSATLHMEIVHPDAAVEQLDVVNIELVTGPDKRPEPGAPPSEGPAPIIEKKYEIIRFNQTSQQSVKIFPETTRPSLPGMGGTTATKPGAGSADNPR